MPSTPGAQARAERAAARDVLDVVHLLVNLVLVLELHPVGLVIEGDALADVEQAVPVAARRTVQLLHPQAAADRVVDRAEALPPFNVGGHAHAVVVVVGVAPSRGVQLARRCAALPSGLTKKIWPRLLPP
ncbi:hypothetical protein G6F50_014918 [Rhizopus delemar]|uniref:Uncharacterized protein n=1 Tax=Rhizopus delemar TaxID=936053 RepID=A0A9P6Y1H4_9FUNG|nr:hypothetical protein G6F50_014918 [Rhizopus delemar]